MVKLSGNTPNKSCQLDAAPTWLVKQYSGLLAPVTALLFNASLSTECFPAKFKHTIVTPLEKKGTRDSSQLKNYCPVSNLLFLSKLLEKVVQNQLQHHITSNDAMPKFQSVYRQFHSTESALIKIFNNLLLAADQGQVSALCLLDLMSAFKGKVKVRVHTLDIAPLHSESPPQERSGMARVLKGFQFYLHTRTFIRNRNEPYLPLPSQPQLVLIY